MHKTRLIQNMKAKYTSNAKTKTRRGEREVTKSLEALFTTKEGDYPSILKIAGTTPKNAWIRSKFLSRHFKSLQFECQYKVIRSIPTLFKSARIGPIVFQTLF